MHRVILGFNVWAVGFLIVAFVLGLVGSPHHLSVGIFATIFALLAQCAIFALFMGATKLLKEHVELYQLPQELIERVNGLMLPLFRWATAASMVVLMVAILGGLVASGDVPAVVHVVLGLIAVVTLVRAVVAETPRLAAMHQILLDMESLIPEDGARPAPAEDAAPDQAPDLRARGLVYVGSTVLVMIAGYKYIAGFDMPATFVGLAVGGAVACLAVAWLVARRPAAQPGKAATDSTSSGSRRAS